MSKAELETKYARLLIDSYPRALIGSLTSDYDLLVSLQAYFTYRFTHAVDILITRSTIPTDADMLKSFQFVRDTLDISQHDDANSLLANVMYQLVRITDDPFMFSGIKSEERTNLKNTACAELLAWEAHTARNFLHRALAVDLLTPDISQWQLVVDMAIADSRRVPYLEAGVLDIKLVDHCVQNDIDVEIAKELEATQ